MSERTTLAGAGAAHLALIAALSLAWARMEKPALPPPDSVAVDLVTIADVPTQTAEPKPATAPPVERAPPEPEAPPPPPTPMTAPTPEPPKAAPPDPVPTPVPVPVADDEPAPKPKPVRVNTLKRPPDPARISANLDKLLAKPAARPAPRPRADATQLASLLDKAIGRAPPRAAAKPGPVQTAQPANAALDAHAAATLQQSIAGQIARCWNVAPGTQNMTVDLHVFLARDGSVAGTVQTIGVTGGANAEIARSFAESARRAVFQCAPLKLPAASYGLWRELIPLHLDPKDIR